MCQKNTNSKQIKEPSIYTRSIKFILPALQCVCRYFCSKWQRHHAINKVTDTPPDYPYVIDDRRSQNVRILKPLSYGTARFDTLAGFDYILTTITEEMLIQVYYMAVEM